MNIAHRAKSTNNKNLELALRIAKNRFKNTNNEEIKANIVFNIQNQLKEPLLNVSDYLCWSIQRIFEKGETRYYNYINDKISLVVDLYDSKNYKRWQNYYSPTNKLTSKNMIK